MSYTTKLYYGNGTCTLEGSDNIMAIQLWYRGAIEIIDKTSDSFAIAAKNNKIVIFPIGQGTLSELFNYNGELKITSVLAVNNNAEKVQVTIHRVMDYSELLHSNSEDMTINSEDLKVGYVSGGKISKTYLKTKIIPNQHTSDYGTLYLGDGSKYIGYLHIHLEDGMGLMTGPKHTKESQDLYFKQKNKDNLIATKNFTAKKSKTKKGTSRRASKRPPRRKIGRGGQ